MAAAVASSTRGVHFIPELRHARLIALSGQSEPPVSMRTSLSRTTGRKFSCESREGAPRCRVFVRRRRRQAALYSCLQRFARPSKPHEPIRGNVIWGAKHDHTATELVGKCEGRIGSQTCRRRHARGEDKDGWLPPLRLVNAGMSRCVHEGSQHVRAHMGSWLACGKLALRLIDAKAKRYRSWMVRTISRLQACDSGRAAGAGGGQLTLQSTTCDTREYNKTQTWRAHTDIAAS